MNWIKDLLYDKNDILVALLILCIAAFVILTRVNAIMEFPERMIAFQGSGGGSVHTSLPEGPGAGLSAPGNHEEQQYGQDGDEVPDEGSGDETTGPSDGGPPEAHSLYIASGQSMTTIAGNLVSLGLFESEQDFIATLEAHNASARVQAGTFIIPVDSTKDEVINIITGVTR